jgi:hypothetical protein
VQLGSSNLATSLYSSYFHSYAILDTDLSIIQFSHATSTSNCSAQLLSRLKSWTIHWGEEDPPGVGLPIGNFSSHRWTSQNKDRGVQDGIERKIDRSVRSTAFQLGGGGVEVAAGNGQRKGKE